MRTMQTLAQTAIAYAEIIRACGAKISAMQRISLDRSFIRVDRAKFHTTPTLWSDSTTEARNKPAILLCSSNDRCDRLHQELVTA